MLMLVVRASRPDAPYWPGRRWLAAVDAIVWPMMACGALSHVAAQGGLLRPFVMALSAVFAVRRLHTALLVNHRYHFTTWRWGRVVAWMLAVGAC